MEMPHVVITHRVKEANRQLIKQLFGEGVKVSYLTDQPEGLRQQTLLDARVLLSWNIPKELGPSELGLLENVRLIQLLSAGADAVPYAGLRPDIVIASNVGAYAEPMAEHVLAMVLALAKNLVQEHRNLGKGEFNQARPNRLLRGKICGILGYGGIGKATAGLMRSLGMEIYAVNTSGRTGDPVAFVGTVAHLRTVLAASDVVVISLPLTKATRGLIGRRELDWMKPDAILINVARGAIIDEGALYEHLVEHPGFMAGIDAWWIEPFSHGAFRINRPFFSLPNVLGSPHNSGIVPGMNEKGTRLAVENVKAVSAGRAAAGNCAAGRLCVIEMRNSESL